MRFNKRLPIVAGLTVACAAIAFTAAAGTRGSAAAAITPTPSSGCQLGNGIKHVIEITFDNVHFNRDNPNVLSDLEQMPALENFITSNGHAALEQPHAADRPHGRRQHHQLHGPLRRPARTAASRTRTRPSTRSGRPRCRSRPSRTGPARTGSTHSRTSRTRPRSGVGAAAEDAARAVGAVHACRAATSATSRPRTWCSRTSTRICRTSSAPTRRRSPS